MKKLPLVIFAAISTIIFFNSCSVDNNNTGPQVGYILFANISPDAPPLTIFANNSAIGIPPLGYGFSSAGYFGASPGSYNIASFGTGTNPLLQNTITIQPSTNYSYFIVDSVSKIKSSFVQDVISTTSSDSVYIRFFNFSPNSTPLSLVNTDNDSTLYSFRVFNDVSSASFARIKANTYNLALRVGDSTVASRLDTLVGTHTYTIFAKGNLGGTGDQAIGIGNIINN